jgi:hypothetical protein
MIGYNNFPEELYVKEFKDNGYTFRRVYDDELTINGRTIEEVRDILNALDLEKIEQLELCMNNLKEYHKRMELEHRTAIQQMIDNSLKNMLEIGDEDGETKI